MKRLNITGYVRKTANSVVPGAEHNRYANILNRFTIIQRYSEYVKSWNAKR